MREMSWCLTFEQGLVKGSARGGVGGYGSVMGQSRKKKNKSSRRSGAAGSRNPRPVRLGSVEKRMPSLFSFLTEVRTIADYTVASMTFTTERLVRFDAEIFTRGINSLKSVELLIREGHWEHAVGVVRQMFELLVNMDYMNTLPDRNEAAFQYCKYGMLQYVQAARRNILYSKETGRPYDEELLRSLDGLLGTAFSEFQGKPKTDGTVRWVTSWCRKTTRDLAEASPDAMAIKQYEILYTVWSEQAHAAPGALIDNIFRTVEDGWIKRAIVADDAHILGIAHMALIFFFRLWLLLPNIEVPVEHFARWNRYMTEEFGVDFGTPV